MTSKMKITPLREGDSIPALAHITFNPGDGGELQFIAIPKDKIHDVVLALLNTHDALTSVRNVESVVEWAGV